MNYDSKKHLASISVRDAFGEMERAYYHDPTAVNLNALTKVREALDAMLKSYYMDAPEPEKAVKEAPHA